LESGIVPIREKFLQLNYLGALEFKEGFVFFRVVRRRVCRYKPYPVIDENGNIIDIAPLTHETEHQFRDPRNTENDVLFLETSTSPDGYPWFLHGAIGIKPQYINMYLRIPQGKDIPGRFPSLSPIRPAAGDDFGYVNSELSPYGDTTDYVELVIPPKVHIGAEYYNKDPARSHQPVLDLYFCIYWIQIFKPEDDKYRRLISDIALRRVPAAFLTAGGGEEPLEMGTALKRDWDVEPISLDQATELR
jgi:hypothetical protein